MYFCSIECGVKHTHAHLMEFHLSEHHKFSGHMVAGQAVWHVYGAINAIFGKAVDDDYGKRMFTMLVAFPFAKDIATMCSAGPSMPLHGLLYVLMFLPVPDGVRAMLLRGISGDTAMITAGNSIMAMTKNDEEMDNKLFEIRRRVAPETLTQGQKLNYMKERFVELYRQQCAGTIGMTEFLYFKRLTLMDLFGGFLLTNELYEHTPRIAPLHLFLSAVVNSVEMGILMQQQDVGVTGPVHVHCLCKHLMDAYFEMFKPFVGEHKYAFPTMVAVNPASLLPCATDEPHYARLKKLMLAQPNALQMELEGNVGFRDTVKKAIPGTILSIVKDNGQLWFRFGIVAMKNFLESGNGNHNPMIRLPNVLFYHIGRISTTKVERRHVNDD